MLTGRENALSLATSYLSEPGITGLIPGNPRLVLSGDPMSPEPERDLWIVIFRCPPQPPGSDCITGGAVMVTIDNETLDLKKY
jgi:hypothetical protein